MLCKTYCFAFQKRRFCTVKAALLPSKRAAFAMPNRNYRFLNKLSLQNKGYALLFQSKNSTNRNGYTLTVKMWLRCFFPFFLLHFQRSTNARLNIFHVGSRLETVYNVPLTVD